MAVNATGALSGAASGAAVGSAVPGIGTAVGAAVGAIVGLFSGGSKPKVKSVLQGFEVSGTVDAAGFHGTTTAFDQKGKRWDSSTQNPVDAFIHGGAGIDPAWGAPIRDLLAKLPAGFSIPIFYQAPPAEGQLPLGLGLRSAIEQGAVELQSHQMLLEQLAADTTTPAPGATVTDPTGATMPANNAAAINTAASIASNTPAAASSSGAFGAPYTDTGASSIAAPIAALTANPLLLAAIVFGAYLLLRGKK